MDGMSRLWSKRCRENFQMQLRYWNLIGRNSGLMFFVYAMILVGGFYYKKWLDTLPLNFPGVLVISIVLALACAHAPIRTFFQRADLVFLLPAEAELGDYFRKSKRYSFWMQSADLLVLWIICAPLYFQSTGLRTGMFFSGFAALLAVKAWAINCSWREQFIEDTLPLRFLRTTLSFCFIYFVLSRQNLIVIGACAVIMVLVAVFLFRRQAADALMRWSRILESDERQAMQFLRFANLFTDVPRLKRRTRARRLLSSLFPVRRFEKKTVFAQIFIKTFIRSDEYLGMYMRLTVIGALLAYFLNIGYFSVFIVVSVVYLTGLQLLPIWNHPFPQALAGLYPLAEQLKRDPFVQLATRLLIGQSFVLSLAAGFGTRSYTAFLIFICAGSAVGLFFSKSYIKRRIQRAA
ncbi:ABC transporter permease [Sporolactobacillus sp. STCC-11]|uniref:ABC transporter permease n=1 Tax=Sporolactobacillus caesalpiniae TaxID=3230362 RepID=UPI0033936DCF